MKSEADSKPHLIRELGRGCTKKAYLYEQNGEKKIILQAVRRSKKRSFLWQVRKEANITRKLPQMRCDIRTVYVVRKCGRWEVSAHYVEGEPLNAELFGSLSEKGKKSLLADFAEFLLTLHVMRVSMLDERYADATDAPLSPLYLLGALGYKIFCLKKTWLSLRNPQKNPYATRKFARKKAKLCRAFAFSAGEVQRLEKTLRAVCAQPRLFGYVGVCFGDFFGSNFLYDKESGRLAALDFTCQYKGNIYEEFVSIYMWMGKEFTQKLLHCYNALAAKRNVRLPSCPAYPLELDCAMVQHLVALRLFQMMPQSPANKEKVLDILHELYPDTTPASAASA